MTAPDALVAWHGKSELKANMTPLELLQCRHDGPIPERERDAARYPTRINQIARAKARIKGARREIAWHMHQWRMQRTYAQGRRYADVDALQRIAGIHMPHLRCCRRELMRWKLHLGKLED